VVAVGFSIHPVWQPTFIHDDFLQAAVLCFLVSAGEASRKRDACDIYRTQLEEQKELPDASYM